MAKKAPKHNDALFRKTFEEGFKKQYQNGLLTGSRAICKVVFDKANDETKDPQTRIDDIKKFCSVALGLPVEKPIVAQKNEKTKDDQA